MSPAPLTVWRRALPGMALRVVVAISLFALAFRVVTLDGPWWRDLAGWTLVALGWVALGRVPERVFRYLLPLGTYRAMRAYAAEKAAGHRAPYDEAGEFDLMLNATGWRLISVIKEIRYVTGLGLAEAKALTLDVPRPVLAGRSYDSCERAATRLRLAGAEVEILRT